MASKAKKGKKKTPSAKVHRITGRHGEEMKLTAYIRRLDKIYTDLKMSSTLIKVVQLLRSKYRKNPHELYLKICKKYGVEPEDEVDAEVLVYGRSRSLSRSRRSLLKDQMREKENQKKSAKKDKKEEKEAPVEEKSDVPKAAANKDSEVQAEKKYNDENAKAEYVSVLPGDIVETMVLIEATKDRETGFWVPARILRINEDAMNMDLQVLQPLKYDLAEKAMGVPYRYVRAPVTVTFEY